jgi:hypothetical protein
MNLKEIYETLKRLDSLVNDAYAAGEIPRYGTSCYSTISETLSILHSELDPLIKNSK